MSDPQIHLGTDPVTEESPFNNIDSQVVARARRGVLEAKKDRRPAIPNRKDLRRKGYKRNCYTNGPNTKRGGVFA